MSTRMDVRVAEGNRYRVLAEHLPWPELAEVANEYRARKVDIDNGRPLNLRLHLGALIGQSMNHWTDRETEDMVAHHAGLRLLCGLEQSSETIDATSIEEFRSQLTKEGVESLNRIVVQAAKRAGFTDGKLCSSDTTVQEAPIAYPTEVGHMKKIGEKLVGIGTKIRRKVARKLRKLAVEAQRTFTQIRLYTRGKGEEVIERKKKLSRELQRTVEKMRRVVQTEVDRLGPDGVSPEGEDRESLGEGGSGDHTWKGGQGRRVRSPVVNHAVEPWLYDRSGLQAFGLGVGRDADAGDLRALQAHDGQSAEAGRVRSWRGRREQSSDATGPRHHQWHLLQGSGLAARSRPQHGSPCLPRAGPFGGDDRDTETFALRIHQASCEVVGDDRAKGSRGDSRCQSGSSGAASTAKVMDRITVGGTRTREFNNSSGF